MTGRSNIIPTENAAIVTDNFDLNMVKWNTVLLGTTESCIRIFQVHTLIVALFTGGYIATSEDGIHWITKCVGDYQLNSVFYDGSQYVICGSNGDKGFIATTQDFQSFGIHDSITDSDAAKLSFVGGTKSDSTYLVFCYIKESSGSKYIQTWTGEAIEGLNNAKNKSGELIASADPEAQDIIFKKENGRFYFYIPQMHTLPSSGDNGIYDLYYSADGMNFSSSRIAGASGLYSPYFNEFQISNGVMYAICGKSTYKSVTGVNWTLISEISTLGTIIAINNQLFVLGYPDKGFVVQSNESLAEKTANNFILIMDDVIIQKAIYALGQMIIICEGGIVLYASQKESDPQTEAVKTMSAKKALSDANAYTDVQIAELKKYIDSKLI